jgi:hypothetical protein
MLRIAALFCLAATSGCWGQPWSPYDADLEARHTVSKDAYLKVDFLTPSQATQALHSAAQCTAIYEVFPSFRQTQHWCLSRGEDGYHLASWETRDPTPGASAPPPEARSVAVPSDIGALLQELWLNAILEARYPRFYLAGLDGDMHYFGATRAHDREMLWAEVWSPRANLPPLWMTQIGAEVFTFAQSTARDDAQLRRHLLDLQGKLYSYYKRHGRH